MAEIYKTSVSDMKKNISVLEGVIWLFCLIQKIYFLHNKDIINSEFKTELINPNRRKPVKMQPIGFFKKTKEPNVDLFPFNVAFFIC